MLNNKAINIIQGLNKKELLRFEKFLSSPFFNNNKKHIRLFRILKKCYPSFTSPQFNKKRIHDYVYEKGKFNDQKLRKLFSDFYKLGEKFLVFLNLENTPSDYNKLLLDELDTKKIDNLFHSKYLETLNSLDS